VSAFAQKYQRERKNKFKNWTSDAHKKWIIEMFHKSSLDFQLLSDCRENLEQVKILPMIHIMSNANINDEIVRTGFSKHKHAIDGNYGKGIYFTSSMDYAAKHSPEDEKYFLIAFIITGDVYPCSESPNSENSLEGRPLITDSHYILVGPPKFYPVKIYHKNFYEVLAIDQDLALPVYLLVAQKKNQSNAIFDDESGGKFNVFSEISTIHDDDKDNN